MTVFLIKFFLILTTVAIQPLNTHFMEHYSHLTIASYSTHCTDEPKALKQ